MNWRWVLITGLIAALIMSYGLLSRRAGDTVVTQAPLARPALYFKDALLSQTRPDGSLQLKLIASRIEQQPGNDNILADTVRVDYLASAQTPWTLTAQQGFVKGGSSVVEFSGNVLMRRDDLPQTGIVRTDKLSVDIDKSLAWTHSPVAIDYGANTLNAVGLKADMKRGTVKLESSLNGRFNPNR